MKIHTLDAVIPCKLALNVSRPGEVFVLSPHPRPCVIVYDFFSGLARTLIAAATGMGRVLLQAPPVTKAQFGRGALMNPRLICCDRRGRVVMESRGQMRLQIFSSTGDELSCVSLQDFFDFPSAMTTWPPAHPTYSINDWTSPVVAHRNDSVLPGAATEDEDELIFIADHRLNLVHALDYTGAFLFSIFGDGVRCIT